MPFDGLTIKRLCYELNQLFSNARIDKIHQPQKDELVFTIRQPGSGTHRLLISANARWARMQVTAEKRDNPVNPPAFCMLLRKYLEGGKIRSIRQIDFDRIVHIEVEALDDYREWRRKVIICEFMGKHSNIILFNPDNNIIIDAIKKYNHELSSFREVLPGKAYLRPSTQEKLDPFNTSFEIFTEYIYHCGDNCSLARALFLTFSGLSPFTCREICLGSGLDEDLALEFCGQIELLQVHQHLQYLMQNIFESSFHSEVAYVKQHPQEYAPYTICSISNSSKKRFNSMNEACQRFFDDRLHIVRLDSMKANYAKQIRDILNKLYRKRFHQEGDLAQARENTRYQVWGELLTAYGYELKKGQNEAFLNDFISGEPVMVQLDPLLNPIQNAQRYFRLYNKSTKAIRHLADLMAANAAEINYLESVLFSIEQAESLDLLEEIVEELEKERVLKEKSKKRRSSHYHSQPRRYISSEGLSVLVGRNNRQNDLLTMKQAERHDLWLHVKEVPGAHVILKLDQRIQSIDEVPDKSLEEAAALAAFHSKASQSEKVAVDYTFRSNIKKPAGARPGMVIYDKYWTLMVNPGSVEPGQMETT